MIIAHRGASNLAPENTCASIRKALTIGCEAIEIDIHLTKDEKIVVHHDYTTERLTDKNLTIETSTLAELKELDVGSHKSTEFKNERIPELNEILALIPETVILFIEIKSDKKIMPYLKIELENFLHLKKQIFIISFDKEVAVTSKKLLKDIPFYFLYHCKPNEFNNSKLNELIQYCQTNGFEGIDINWKLIDEQAASTILNSNLGLYCWTVNEKSDAESLFKMNVDGVATDKPELFGA